MQTTVGVLRGGVGPEHDISLKSGSAILSHFGNEKELSPFRTNDIYVDRNGVWYVRGVPKDPSQALSGVDVVWNSLRGEYGEDGTVQRILGRLGVPYTGSRAYASAVSINKTLTKKTLKEVGIQVPRSTMLSVSANLPTDIVNAFRSFPQPSVIKPNNLGSSIGVTIATSFEAFERGVHTAFQYSSQVMIEELISGKEATCGVVDSFQNESLYALPPIEIMFPKETSFFDYETKYNDLALENCPGNFSQNEIRELKRLAKLAHTTLGLRHYSRSDFVVSPRGIYLLEVNTLPAITNGSSILKSLSVAGMSPTQFVRHVLNLALSGR